MNNQLSPKLFYIAFVLALMLLIPYEYYWREIQHYSPSYDLESLDAWAGWRATIDDCDESDVVIMGSSRGHFN